MSEFGISAEWLQRLAGSLLHFVWEGALLVLAAAILLHLLARRPAAWRYTVAVVFLGLMLLAPCVTILFYPETGSAALRVLQVFRSAAGDANASVDAATVLQWTSWIVLAWACGVTGFSLRLITGWLLSIRLIRSAQSSVPETVERLLSRVHETLLATRRIPRLRIGERVTGPVVFGWLRPVVLLPVSAVTGLSEEQLLAVLAHELAHVRRYDFLVNALQRGVESVLFYHPAVWWLSARIRTEREHCCDDLAVSVCGDQFAYAEALIELERMRSETLALAVSGTGNLTQRIRRVLGAEDNNRDWKPAMAALLLLGICVVAGLGQENTMVTPAFAAVPPAPSLTSALEQPAPPAAPPLESTLGALEAIATAQVPQASTAGDHWITTWGAALGNIGVECCNNQTVRMFMRVSAGGNSVRLRLTNTYGTAPLFFGQVRVALHDRGSEIVSGSDHQVLFAGKPSVEIPIGQTITSDPVNLNLPALADVAISIYAPNETGSVTGAVAWRNGYVVAGDLATAQGLTGAKLTKTRYWVSGIEVLAPSNSSVIVVVSDANTETDSDRSWPDFLVPRLLGSSATRNRAVVLSGDASRLFNPGQSSVAFSDIVARQTGVRYLMLCPSFPTLAYVGFGSMNVGFGSPNSAPNKGFSPEDRIIQSLKSVVDQARSRSISTIGCTLPPQKPALSFGRDDEFRDEKGQDRKVDTVRVAINEWMRTSGTFEGLVDFDALTRDTSNPGDVKEEFRSPGYPQRFPPSTPFNERGHQALAEAIDLSLFARQ